MLQNNNKEMGPALNTIQEKILESNQEATVLRALCLFDQGQVYESI